MHDVKPRLATPVPQISVCIVALIKSRKRKQCFKPQGTGKDRR